MNACIPTEMCHGANYYVILQHKQRFADYLQNKRRENKKVHSSNERVERIIPIRKRELG